MPKVSIITPTVHRQHFLRALWDCVRQQTHGDFEWLISDGSLGPAYSLSSIDDPRMRYFHHPQPMTIGARRNALCEMASGEIIVHFDDDDYYAPHYIAFMLSVLQKEQAHFVKLAGFHVFSMPSNAFGYYDLEYDLPLHFVFQPQAQKVETARYVSAPNVEWGFGFSYVFSREAWRKTPFPDRNHGEDIEFANAVRAHAKSVALQDTTGLCIHVIHQSNSSMVFPQKLLRASLLSRLFPDFDTRNNAIAPAPR